MNLALERAGEAARRLALPVARVSVEATRIPAMDLLLKITDAYRPQALGIQHPKRIRVARPQPSLKKPRIKVVLVFLEMLMVVAEAAINAVGARTKHNNMRRRYSFSHWLLFCGCYFQVSEYFPLYIFGFHSTSTEI